MKKGTIMLILGAVAGIFAYKYYLKGGTVKTAIDSIVAKVKETATGVTTITDANIADTPTTNGASLSSTVDTTGTLIVPVANESLV